MNTHDNQNLTVLTIYYKNSYDYNNNPLSKIDANVIIFIEYDDYDYINKIRENFKDKTFLLIVFNNLVLNDKQNYITKMIEANPFKSQKFAWCDIAHIESFLSKPLETYETININSLNDLNNEEIKKGILIKNDKKLF